jgi:hypothetical protein
MFEEPVPGTEWGAWSLYGRGHVYIINYSSNINNWLEINGNGLHDSINSKCSSFVSVFFFHQTYGECSLTVVKNTVDRDEWRRQWWMRHDASCLFYIWRHTSAYSTAWKRGFKARSSPLSFALGTPRQHKAPLWWRMKCWRRFCSNLTVARNFLDVRFNLNMFCKF